MLHTRIEQDFFQGKGKINVISLSDEKYIYKIIKDKNHYLAKGYKIAFVPLNYADAKDNYIESLRQLSLIYQEYYLAYFDTTFSHHFAKPLSIATKFVLPESSGEDALIYAEILFEYPGESLDKYRKKTMENLWQIYNWMQQSANGLAFLHAAGISHLDIKPNNMMYNEANDQIKIMDMDNSAAYTSQTQLFSSAKSVTTKIKELTIYYAPPEVLQQYNSKALGASPISDPIDFIIRNIDVYCWAMCFYSLLLKKKDKELECEVSKHRLCNSEDYGKFLESIKEDIGKLQVKEEEQKLKSIIQDTLISALQYNPKSRPKFSDVIKNMRDYDQAQGISIKYNEIKTDVREKTEIMIVLRKTLKEKEENLKILQEKLINNKKEFESLEGIEIKPKEQVAALMKEKKIIDGELSVKRKELENIPEDHRDVSGLDKLRNRNIELKKQLASSRERLLTLTNELNTQKTIGISTKKKSASYNTLKEKYENEISVLTKANLELNKRIQQLTQVQ